MDEQPTGDGRMRLAATAFPVATERRGVSRVLVPAAPLRNLFVFSPDNGYGYLLGSREWRRARTMGDPAPSDNPMAS